MSAERCATCGEAASGWVGRYDLPDATADQQGRVWLCPHHLDPIFDAARRGARIPLPGQEQLFAS